MTENHFSRVIVLQGNHLSLTTLSNQFVPVTDVIPPCRNLFCCRALCGAFVINCCYAARGIRVSSTTTKTVDCPDLTFFDTDRNIAGGKISLNVNGRVVSPACIAGVLISPPKFNAL
jgi:hypothetical protein